MEAAKTYFGNDESIVEMRKKKRVVEKAASLYDLRFSDVKNGSFHFLQVEGVSQVVRRFVQKSAYSWKITALNASKGANIATTSNVFRGTTGAGAKATGAGAKATGAGAKATGAGARATGAGARATGAGAKATGAGAKATGAGAKATGAGAKANRTMSDFFPFKKVARMKRGGDREPVRLQPYAATSAATSAATPGATPDPDGGADQKVVCRAVYFQSDPWDNWQRIASAVGALGASTIRVDSPEDAERRFQSYRYFRLYGTDVDLKEAERVLKATFGDTFLHDKFAQISMSTGTRRGAVVVDSSRRRPTQKKRSASVRNHTAAKKRPAKKPQTQTSLEECTDESDGGDDMLYDECNIDAIKQGIKQGVGKGNGDDDTDPRVESKRRRCFVQK